MFTLVTLIQLKLKTESANAPKYYRVIRISIKEMNIQNFQTMLLAEWGHLWQNIKTRRTKILKINFIAYHVLRK